jgi:hypothetical protein
VSRRPAGAPDSFGHGVTLTSRGRDGWRVRWFEPPDSRRIENRHQKSFGPARLDDARDFAREIAEDLELRGAGAGDRRARRATPWRDGYARWAHVKATSGDWSPSNAEQVRQLLDKWAAPALGHLPMADIQRDDYQRVLAAMHAAGKDGSRDRVRSLLAGFGSVFDAHKIPAPESPLWAAQLAYGPLETAAPGAYGLPSYLGGRGRCHGWAARGARVPAKLTTGLTWTRPLSDRARIPAARL